MEFLIYFNNPTPNCSSLIFLFLFLVTPFSASSQNNSKPYIISGLDDVLRQAENTGLIKVTLKIFEKDKAFAGMSELYSVISAEESGLKKFSLVSAISIWFDERIEELLTQNKFPEHDRYLRNWLTEWSIEKFKMSRVERILSEKPDRKFIVVFDNSDASLLLSRNLYDKYYDRIQDIYLRQIVSKELPKGVVPFFSAFDIALNEHSKSRLTDDEAIRVGNSVVKEKDLEKIIPAYAFCPPDYNPCLSTSKELKVVCEKVKMKVDNICKMRK